MKTYIVISDSHGRREAVERLRPLFEENDGVLHLGDGASDVRQLALRDPKKYKVMKGNCDFSGGLEEYEFEEEGVKVFCCHGHRYGVKHGREELARRAKALGCAVALYGHTHTASIEEIDGVMLVNPGALSDWTSPSYCYLVLHNGKATATIVPVVKNEF